MNLRLLAEAEEEVQSSAEWFEKRREGPGIAFLDEVSDAFDAIETHPDRFPKWSELEKDPAVRGYSLARFPFQIVHEMRTDEVIILAVAHHKRRPGYWSLRRP